MNIPDKCILCDFPLFGRGSLMSEGWMCQDSAGCRRRALALMQCPSIGRTANVRCTLRKAHEGQHSYYGLFSWDDNE